jgi:hypothetical protein
MKKKITLAVLCLLATSMRAQSGLTTSSITLISGIVKTSLFLEIRPKIHNSKLTGNILYELYFYNSYADKIAGRERVYPLLNGLPLYTITVSISDTDIINSTGVTLLSNVNLFHYQKVKSALLTQYSITTN